MHKWGEFKGLDKTAVITVQVLTETWKRVGRLPQAKQKKRVMCRGPGDMLRCPVEGPFLGWSAGELEETFLDDGKKSPVEHGVPISQAPKWFAKCCAKDNSLPTVEDSMTVCVHHWHDTNLAVVPERTNNFFAAIWYQVNEILAGRQDRIRWVTIVCCVKANMGLVSKDSGNPAYGYWALHYCHTKTTIMKLTVVPRIRKRATQQVVESNFTRVLEILQYEMDQFTAFEQRLGSEIFTVQMRLDCSLDGIVGVPFAAWLMSALDEELTEEQRRAMELNQLKRHCHRMEHWKSRYDTRRSNYRQYTVQFWTTQWTQLCGKLLRNQQHGPRSTYQQKLEREELSYRISAVRAVLSRQQQEQQQASLLAQQKTETWIRQERQKQAGLLHKQQQELAEKHSQAQKQEQQRQKKARLLHKQAQKQEQQRQEQARLLHKQAQEQEQQRHRPLLIQSVMPSWSELQRLSPDQQQVYLAQREQNQQKFLSTYAYTAK
jgi:hypothetical protein